MYILSVFSITTNDPGLFLYFTIMSYQSVNYFNIRLLTTKLSLDYHILPLDYHILDETGDC